MSCPCCLQTPCVSLCRMPQELEATIVSNGVTATFDWSITAGEIATIESFIEGTYSLQYQSYSGSYAEYAYFFPNPPYDYIGASNNVLRVRWFCTSSGGYSGSLYLNACSTTATSLTRRLSGGTVAGGNLPDSDFPDITDYCLGAAAAGGIVTTTNFLPDTPCTRSRLPRERGALFDLDITLSD
jgi:hypothetical protein